jgi:exodeoxyribonuclease-3
MGWIILIKLASWNVNGFRACLKKGFLDSFAQIGADVFCLQETKMQQGQAEFDLGGNNESERFLEYWNSADKKGYSGTAVFTRIPPLSVAYGMGIDEHDHEGRMITLEFDAFYLVNVYTPNSQGDLARLGYRMRWEDDFKGYVCGLDAMKPVIICGDLNCAHQEIDLKNPKTNQRNAGFTREERDKMTVLLESGFTDIYRRLNPDKHDAYTWWSYMPGVREKNVGWRIDYFLGSDRFFEKIRDASILPEIHGSDHCPVTLNVSRGRFS